MDTHLGSVPVVSVLLPVYNAGRYLRTTLDSVLAQTFTDFEVIAIDDGSTDDSPAILSAYRDPRIRVVKHPHNRGLIATLNEGIELARGRYIARMDSDDVMHPDRLAKQVKALEEDTGSAVLATFVRTVNADGDVVGEWDVDRATANEASIRAMLPRTNCIAHPSVMVRRSALGDLRYDPRQPGHEDWDLWLRMLARGLRIAKLAEPLLDYRIHTESIMGAQKRSMPLERRLLVARHRFLTGALLRAEWNMVHMNVLYAQVRSLARHLRINALPALARNLHRWLTYSPIGILREQYGLRRTERTWRGRTAIFIPYLHTGGAEQVHADIAAAVRDASPLVVVNGFSTDRRFAPIIGAHATVLELPRSLNHPFWKHRTLKRLAALINAQHTPTLLGALSGSFFELLPFLHQEVPAYYLQHAFKFQPEGNVQHRNWLRYFNRITGYLFISSRSRDEFARFLHANHVPQGAAAKLHFISNAVTRFGTMQQHEQLGLIWVGRDAPEKRLPLFLALADRLERALPGAFRFTIIGPERSETPAIVRSMGLLQDGDRVAEIMAAHDVLVLTSDREGFPMVIMEAMAQGLVIASTPVGDVPLRIGPAEAVITSTTEADGVLEELTAAILALHRDRTRLQGMKAAALAKAKAEFAPEEFGAAYRALLIRP
jgi:glycosyltransferase involved in cell wall biosynthesis